MEKLTDAGFAQNLATEALAATGGRSMLRATLWILNHRRCEIERKAKAPSKRQRQDESENHLKFLGDVSSPMPARPAIPSLKQFPKASSVGKNRMPLAERMRPITVDDVIGQDHLLGPRGILRTLLDANKISSAILWGPPGTGKTSLARAISRAVSYRFEALSAGSSKVKKVQHVLEEARRHKDQTLVFLDDIHKFNKAHQDIFVPYLKAGHIVFIGATTENPSSEINTSLLSCCKVLILKKLQPEHLSHLIERAVLDKVNGILMSFPEAPTYEKFRIEEGAIHFLTAAADGDARVALNALELAGRTAVSRFRETTQVNRCIFDREGHNYFSSFSSRKESGSSDRAMVGFVAKGDGTCSISEALNFEEQYTRTFKQFVGGEQVTTHTFGLDREMMCLGHFAADKEVAGKARELKEKKSRIIASDAIFGKGGNRSSRFGCLSEQQNVPWESFGNPRADRAPDQKGSVVVTLADVRKALHRSHAFCDKTGEKQRNPMSALRKSMRGGDANAGIYWLSRIMEGGERVSYVAQRLIRFASQEVGLADPHALVQALACFQACQLLGFPECNTQLAQCVVYLALAPKSSAIYQGIQAAKQSVRKSSQNQPDPLH